MTSDSDNIAPGLPAAEFEDIFRKAGVLVPALDAAKSAKAKATRIGKFLSLNVGREVPIEVDGRTGKAKLCLTIGRAKKKLYHFEIRWDEPSGESTPVPGTARLDDGLDDTPGVWAAERRASEPAPCPAEARQAAEGGQSEGNQEAW